MIAGRFFYTSLAFLTLAAGCGGVLPTEPSVGENIRATICGTADDSQWVNDYDGSLGPSIAFVSSNKGPVGALENSGADNSSKFCSGTLIANDLLLTAGHCVDRRSVGKYVSFNYERVAGGSSLLAQSHHRISAVVEDGKRLDYAIIRLDGNPGATFGVAPVASADAAVGDSLTIIGHPEGLPKKIEAGTLSAFSGDYLQYGDLDTLGGNSGSGILDASGRIVGVHTNGGCTSTGGANSGVRISKIRATSSTL